MNRTRLHWGVLLVALGAMFWGLDAPFRVPLITIGMSSPAIVLAEHLVIAVYSIPVVALSWAVLRRLRPLQWGTLVLIAWGPSALATVLFTEAFRVGDPTTVILLQKAQPLFAILLARLALGERLTPIYWPLFGVAMLGAYLVAFSSLDPVWRLPQAPVMAAVLALGAALLWGAGTVLGRFMLAGVPFHTLTGLRFLLAIPFLAALALPQGGLPQVGLGFVQQPFALIVLALAPGLAGLLIYYRGLQTTPAAVATLAELAFPLTAIVVGWLFLSRVPSVTQMIGFALLWLALLALTRIDAARAPAPAAEQPASAPSPG